MHGSPGERRVPDLYGYARAVLVKFAGSFPMRTCWPTTWTLTEDPTPPTSFESVVQRKDGAERTGIRGSGSSMAQRRTRRNGDCDPRITLRRRARASSQAEWELNELRAESRARAP